ncbi:uncharacterized protein LOC123547308 [Mercenaria mercenaria]|uniref:uncharacterized protein LOC123547308 n=1 Tax=Mercenaria mercenaria TaxID=6596 RepID=UPI00234F2198|nr:uncharacterized protein LOC123547308 [Mercenaria mercenaria]
MTDLRMCCYCHRMDSNLKRCSRCYSVYYCSKGCQAMDWIEHKTSCSKTAFDIHTKMKSEYSDAEKNIRADGKLTSRKKDMTVADDDDSFEEKDKVMKSDIDTEKNKNTPNIELFRRLPTTKDDTGMGSSVVAESADGFYNDPELCIGTAREADKSSSGADSGKKSVTNLCAYCSRQGCFQKCSRCKDKFYCSTKCQRNDWSSHKGTCVKKLTAEENRIKKLHEKMTIDNENHRRFQETAGGLKRENKDVFTSFIKNYQGPDERIWEMLTLDQALYLAKRPSGSLAKAVRMAKIFFPLYNIVTDFDDVPSESVFPFFPFMVPPRGRYVLVAFMYRYHEHVMRHGVYLKDAQDKESKVEFYFDHLGDNPRPFFSYSQVKPGGYICLVDPVMHLFGDGSVGVRINNPEEVKVLDIEMDMK